MSSHTKILNSAPTPYNKLKKNKQEEDDDDEQAEIKHKHRETVQGVERE